MIESPVSIRVKVMPEQSLLEEYLAGGLGKRSVVFNREAGAFERTEERPHFRANLLDNRPPASVVDGWAPIPVIKKLPDQALLERFLRDERICFRPSLGVFEPY